jgi:rod shape-determining protein MreC
MKKLNVIALLLFVVAVAAVFMLDTPATRSIQTRVMNILSPFIRAGAITETEVKHAVETPLDAATLRQDNERLQQQVKRLRIIEQKYEQSFAENNKFRILLNYQQQTPFKLTPARVLRRSSSNWWTTLIIDKGSLDGVGTDSPVITDVGLVGKTGKVALHSAEVMLLTDEEVRVSARVEGTQAKGILTGERGGLEVRPDLRLRFLDRTAKIESGAKIYSSGDGGVFPAGLLLGKVKAVETRDVAAEATVEAAVDFSLLDDVFVVQAEQSVNGTAAATGGMPR